MSDDKPQEPEYVIHHPCGEGADEVHAVGVHSDGSMTDMGHGKYLKDGDPILPGMTCYHLDGGTGRVLHSTRAPGDGPAKVSTPEYRDGWDRIFGNGKVVGEA